MTEQKEKLWFVFGGMALIIVGFDVLTGVHYGYNLDGLIMLAAMAVIALGSFLAFFCAYFAVKYANQNLKVAAFLGKALLIVIGGLSAASIITLYFEEKGAAVAAERAQKQTATETDAKLQLQKAAAESEIARLKALEDAAIKLKQSTRSVKVTSTFLERNAAVVGEKKESSPTPTLTETTNAEIEKEKGKVSGVKKWLLEYSRNGIYVVPVIGNIFVFLGMSLALMFAPRSREEMREVAAEAQAEAEALRLKAQQSFRYDPNDNPFKQAARPTSPLPVVKNGRDHSVKQ